MIGIGPAALFGLCFGFMFVTGCSLAIMYSIYQGGYRKGVEESLAPEKSKRFTLALARIEARRRASAQASRN